MNESKRCFGVNLFSRLALAIGAFAVIAGGLGAPSAYAAQATISWSAPTTNVDGTQLTDLAGYKVHIGNAPGSYQQTVDVGNVRSYVANNLNDVGTYYFAVTAYNAAGVESPFSVERSRTFGGGGGAAGIAINCGSDASYTDASGLLYLADSEFTGGTAGFSGVSINNTNDDPLYQSERWGTSSYSIPLANGNYELTLKFSETYWTAAGRRVFDVTVGGQVVINDLDIFARAGANTAYDVVLPVAVTNGSLNIGFVSQVDNAKVNAIKLVPVAAPASFTITASASAGGSITPAGATSVKSGASQSYAIAPAAGYRIASVVVDGSDKGALTTYSFTSVNANHSIAASFAAVPTNTAFAVNAGGVDFTAADGTVFRADAGFTGGTAGTSSVAINGTNDDALYQSERWGASSYAIPMANGRYDVTLKFAETYWTAAGRRVFDVRINGVTVASGVDIFARAGANTAYDLVIPGISVANNNLAIEFVNRVDNAKICAIRVAPAKTNFTITASAGTGGSISPAGVSSFAAGSAPVYTMTPAAGYRLANVTIDGISVGALASFTFTSLNANHTISATFNRLFTITSSAGAGGTISPVGTAAYAQGSSPVFRIAPAAGYRIGSVTVDGVNRGAITSYTFSALAANHTISAAFVRTFTITTTAGAGGSVSPAGTATFDQGASPVVTITPAAGYRIANVVVDGVARGVLSTMSFPSLSANHTVSASFSVIPRVAFATNSGGGAFTDASGVSYQADTAFTGGNAGTMGVAIGNTVDDVLYQSERWGTSSYSIPLANGNYELTLKFSETVWSAAGRRVFDVTVNGVTLVSGLDIFARAGRNNAYDVVLPVSVTSGTLRIGFVSRIDNAKVNAIVVRTR